MGWWIALGVGMVVLLGRHCAARRCGTARDATTHSPGLRRRFRGTRVGFAAAILLVVGATAGCAYNPPGAVWVPGSYEIDLWAPTLTHPQGSYPAGEVAVCVDQPTAIGFTGGHEIRLTWGGTTYTTSPTPVVGPGCGTLYVIGADCCYVPHYVTVTLTKE